jgi:hypothetical protein
MAYSSYRLKENSTVGRCRRHQRTAIDGRAEPRRYQQRDQRTAIDEGQRRYQWRDQRTAIDGKAEKVSAESVQWEGKEEWATIVD